MKTFILILTAIILVGCTEKPNNKKPIETIKGRVFICNEGNFMYNNASLTVYNPETKKFANQVFYNTNEFPLGDVFQSMTIIGDKGFMVINNSGKIIVISADDYTLVNTITELTSPRFIQQINDLKCYVSDLYSNSITIFDPTTYKITGSINVGHTTEQMVLKNGYVYVCSWSRDNTVHKIDTESDKVVKSISVTKQPNSMVLDSNGKLWVLSDGSYVGSPDGVEKGALTRINPETMEIEAKFEFADEKMSPTQLKISPDLKTLYFINGNWDKTKTGNSIMRMNISDTSLPEVPFISVPETLFYAIGIDPETSEIYVSNAVDYVRRGTVMRYSQNGKLIHSFDADIIPANFCFR